MALDSPTGLARIVDQTRPWERYSGPPSFGPQYYDPSAGANAHAAHMANVAAGGGSMGGDL